MFLFFFHLNFWWLGFPYWKNCLGGAHLVGHIPTDPWDWYTYFYPKDQRSDPPMEGWVWTCFFCGEVFLGPQNSQVFEGSGYVGYICLIFYGINVNKCTSRMNPMFWSRFVPSFRVDQVDVFQLRLFSGSWYVRPVPHQGYLLQQRLSQLFSLLVTWSFNPVFLWKSFWAMRRWLVARKNSRKNITKIRLVPAMM